MMSFAFAIKLVPDNPAHATAGDELGSPIGFKIKYLVPADGFRILLLTVTFIGSMIALTADNVLVGSVPDIGVNRRLNTSVGS